ncbi:UNVERIFIED_CONTAM: GDSL esterase/lipase [Sesamum latifolium]|uniref:GDSL esterase/lipase n=1 Tax=Sesamum latifolium TaxID=2727402 RepID=A0AAW2XUP8_9LAMI
MGNLSVHVLCQFLAVVVLVGSRLCLGKYIPANFVFGDSLVDAGNNNYILSLSKANFAPNGIDFGQQIGLIGFTPPYLAPTTTGPAILQGVNYASGGGGILNYTGNIFRLYDMGARKIIVANVGPIGCIPFQRDINPSAAAGDGCAVFPNQLAQLFNAQLRALLTQLRADLHQSNFIYADVYRIVHDIIQNYSSYGFDNANSACCGVGGRFGSLIPCGPTSKVCEDRSKYVFWDPFHPTDAANSIIAMHLVDGDSEDIWPINIRQLMRSEPLD